MSATYNKNNNTCTDTYSFNNHKIFKLIRACLPEEKNQSQNLVDCKDDVLFVWNAKDNCIVTLNWRVAKIKETTINYQTLMLSSTQNYTVNNLIASQEGSLIALSGISGVTIVELPQRWGAHGQFQDGKNCIICRSYNLDETFFLNNNQLAVHQIRWHPGSPTDSHLLVLLSDNSIRIYDEGILRHVWRIGPVPRVLSSPTKNLSFLTSLGNTAVDFDISPPRVVTINDEYIGQNVKQLSSKKEKVEWPIIILRGDGNLYILLAGLDTEKPQLQGPLSILPVKEDNYGVDSCSVLVIPTLPSTIVIAEASGKLHHGLLLDAENLTMSCNTEENLNYYPPEYSLHIIETVELELGLSENKNNKNFTCPIQLKRDLNTDSRYFAYHDTGLHSVTVGFVKELLEFIDSDTETNMGTQLLTKASQAEYIVCTKATNNTKINAILGFTILQSPSGLFLLLASGQVVSLDLINDPSILQEIPQSIVKKDAMIVHSPLKKILHESFATHIKSILKSGLSQPILKLDRSVDSTAQDAFELLMNATQVFREHYFTKHEKVHQEMKKRLKVLELLKKQQQQDILHLQKEKDKIRCKAERLAEIYEDTCEKQQNLFKKAQELLRIATSNLPRTAIADKDYAQQIEKLGILIQNLSKNVKLIIANKHEYIMQLEQIYAIEQKKKQLHMPLKKQFALNEVLSQMSLEIENSVKEVKQINQILNL